ncbi:hypothetical protein DFQ26_000474, partial [Actinomortierella ambigua]
MYILTLGSMDCFAVDKVQTVATSILTGQFISSLAMTAHWFPRDSSNVLTDDKNKIHRDLRRSLLTPLCGTLSLMQATLVILGTALV